jgi:hypothetical protein
MRRTENRRRPAIARYDSLHDFYRADERRVRSRESDVGLWWRETADGPLHRAAWVSDTGELYLVRLGRPEEGGGRVEVLATITERERLEHALAGWRRRCGEPQSLGWLRERATAIGRRVRAERARATAAVAGAGAVMAAGFSMAAALV